MAENAKDELAALRAAQEQLAMRITRFSLIRLAFLFIIVFTLPNVLYRVNRNEDINKLKLEIRAADKLLGELKRCEAGDCPGYAEAKAAAAAITQGQDSEGQVRASLPPPPVPAPAQPQQTTTLANIEQLAGRVKELLGHPRVKEYLLLRAQSRESRAKGRDYSYPLEQLRIVEATREVEDYRQARQKLDEQFDLHKVRFENLETEAWSPPIPLLGAGPKLDLRKWIYMLPFLFLLTELYVQIYRRKLSLLHTVAACRVMQVENATYLDKLQFQVKPGELSEYARHPSELEKWLYLASLLFLAGYLWVTGTGTYGQLFYNWTDRSWGHYGHMVLTATFYAVAYYQHVSFRMEAQVQALTGVAPRPTAVAAALNKSRRFARRLVGHLRDYTTRDTAGRPLQKSVSGVREALPGLTLGTASLLVLATLWLSMGASCTSRGYGRHAGYELLLQREDVWWYSATYLTKRWPNLQDPTADLGTDAGLNTGRRMTSDTESESDWGRTAHDLGVAFYFLSVTLAALSLAVVFLSLARWRLPGERQSYTLFAASLLLSLYVTVDFAFSSFWFQKELFPVRPLIWLTAGALWVRALYLPADSERWRRYRNYLTVLFAPLLLNACALMTNALLSRLTGVPVYFAGLLLLALGYWLIFQRSLAARTPTPQVLERGESRDAVHVA